MSWCLIKIRFHYFIKWAPEKLRGVHRLDMITIVRFRIYSFIKLNVRFRIYSFIKFRKRRTVQLMRHTQNTVALIILIRDFGFPGS